MTAADPFLAEIRRKVIARTGLACYLDREDSLTDKIEARMDSLGLARSADYLAALDDTACGGEWDQLIDDITIGETFFFRYPAQWDALRDVVIPERRRELGSAPLKVLCAGYANGAEPYSLSILLHLDLDYRDPISILGADISPTRIAQAEQGAFGAWELRALPERYRDCFVVNGKGWILKDEYRRGVEFRKLNLAVESAAFAARHAGAFDVVLCRNVMIYFAAETNRALLKDFHACLKDGGWFITGHAEPYLEISNVFRPEPLTGAMLYRKLGQGKQALSAPPLPKVAPSAAQKRQSAPSPSTPKRSAPPSASPTVMNAGTVRRLANAGEWREAIAMCNRLSVTHPLDTEWGKRFA